MNAEAGVATPMFPLGSVLFPGEVLPLRVFEPRYQVLVDRCLADGSAFGVILIARGFEVGGDDERSTVGTLAQIVEATDLGSGQWSLITVGTERFHVTQWLDDDPHPLAVVEALPDTAPDPANEVSAEDLAETVATVSELLGRCFDIAAVQLQRPDLAGGPELPPDALNCSWAAAAAAPLTAHDRQRLLEAANAPDRLTLLSDLLTEHLETVELMRGLES